ncbi:hypothetical protein AWC38_SpisGene15445 [Stylophora pistillata]|uniref:Uncharacterized protein n=1 Tax=Stylophora pistillata TaxID=50429 RepID=A0A2B4RR81_STYPI|nr:hypothetical protein AWC38_SpisGene15445 [Stylophora pistillata]
MALWHTGIMYSMDDAVLCELESYGIDLGSSVTEMDDNCNAVVRESQVQWTEQEMTVLRNHVPDPLEYAGKSEIQVDNRTVSTPGDMAEAFNELFTNIAQVLAQEVPAAEVDPEFYLSYTDKAFCPRTPSLDVVFNLLRKIDEKNATGLHMIPSKLLKMAASIVAFSLTARYTKSIPTAIYPTEWNTTRRLNARCEEIDINIDDTTIRRVDHTKSLGLTVDAQLSWSKHVDDIGLSISQLQVDFSIIGERGSTWSQIAQNLNIHPGFTVSQRAVRDRYGILEKKAKKRQRDIENGTGISPEVSEPDLALEEIIEKWEAAEQEFHTDYNNKAKKLEKDKETAEVRRKMSMETFGASKKRKAESDESP